MRTMRNNLREAGGVAVASALLLCACAPENQPDADRRFPSFVSLNPCLDDILVTVARPEQILALSHYSRDPASASMDVNVAARFGVTGGTAEEVIAIQPDYVLASTFIAPATKRALEEAGMEVVTFGSPATQEESLAQTRAISQLAQNLAGEGDLSSSIAAFPNKPEPFAAKPPSVLLWQPGQIIAGDASLVAEHIGWAGFTNYSEQKGLAQADYISLETLLADPPDILMIAGDTIGQNHPLLETLPDTLVVNFAPNFLYCGGPTIPRARARMMEIREEYAEWQERRQQS